MHKTSGNILFLILIAVALFAALSYAVTQTTQGSGSVSKDKTKLLAARMLNHISEIQRGIQHMRLINRCSDTQLSFESAQQGGFSTHYVNPSAPADKRCHLYDPNGGAVTFEKIPDDPNGFDLAEHGWGGFYHFSGYVKFYEIGSEEAELVLHLPHIYDDLCMEIAKGLGGNGVRYSASDIGWFTLPQLFRGVYTDYSLTSSATAGQKVVCRDSGTTSYDYNFLTYALIER